MSDDSKISPLDAGDGVVAGTYKNSAATSFVGRDALREKVAEKLYHCPPAPFSAQDNDDAVRSAYEDADAVMPIVDELQAMVSAAGEAWSGLKRELRTARSDADRANRLLSRLHAEKQHQDPDLRARIRAAIEEAYGGVAGAGERLDTATEAACAVAFPALGSAWQAVQERDKVLATTREERDVLVADSLTMRRELLVALRAVLDIHKPVTLDGSSFCPACRQPSGNPCPTLRAISPALGVS